MIITINHIRQSKMCIKGARAFAKRHDIDWPSFLKNGIDEKDLIGTNDAMATKIVEAAHGKRTRSSCHRV